MIEDFYILGFEYNVTQMFTVMLDAIFTFLSKSGVILWMSRSILAHSLESVRDLFP